MAKTTTCENGHTWEPGGATNGKCPFCDSIADDSLFESSAANWGQDETLDGSQSHDTSISDAIPLLTGAAAVLPTVPGYEILKEIGRGGMGVVYSARQLTLNRTVALKVLVTAGRENGLARAQIEAESVAQLQHPNIVQIFEVHAHGDGLVFAFEFVDGGPLRAGDVQSPRHAAELVETLARAAHSAHEHGIVHRDLKPSNILLTQQGVPKIADFGLAKRIKVDSHQTQDGMIMGTPHYMAPEQAAGRNDEISAAVDIYALGAILYQLLTKQTPFDADQVMQLLQKVQHEEPMPPRKLAAKIHADLDTICLKCLEKEPANRYLSGQDLAEDLRRFLDGQAIEAKPVGWLLRQVRWLKKNAIAAGLVGMAAVAAGLVVSMFLSGARRAEHERQLADRQPANIKRPLGLPPFSIPSDNPVTVGKVRLGHQLFYDRRLSIDNSISCADCHMSEQGWSDGRDRSVGVGEQVGDRNSVPIVNAAYAHFLFWDGRANNLEEQATQPILNPDEMGMPSLLKLVAKLTAIDGYQKQFDEVFDDGLTQKNVGAAIAAFERTLVAGNAPYDSYLAGQKTALSGSALRGKELFFHKAHCAACHSGALFTDGGFHNIGTVSPNATADLGRHQVTGVQGDVGSFRTPTLRDVSRTAPYMHDGQFASLPEVIDYYVRGGRPHPQLDEEIFELDLSESEKADLLEFLVVGLTSKQYPDIQHPELPE